MRTARMVVAVAVAAMVGAVGASFTQAATVIKKSGKTWIVDQNGERWDVIQVESLGFDPRGFQYGIGRNAFTPRTIHGSGKRATEFPGRPGWSVWGKDHPAGPIRSRPSGVTRSPTATSGGSRSPWGIDRSLTWRPCTAAKSMGRR